MSQGPEEEILLRYLDGALSPEETGRLSAKLREDPGLRRRMAEILLQGAMLREIAGGARSTVPSRSRLGPALAAAAAARLVAAVGAAYWLSRPAVRGRVTSVSLPKGGAPAAFLGPGGVRRAAAPGVALHDGDRLESGAAAVRLEYTGEATELEAQPGTVCFFGTEGGAKRVRLERGEIAAEIAPHPPGRPMRFLTPQAAAEVRGTRLRLSAGPRATLLEVEEGTVRLERAGGGAAAEVPSGFVAVAAERVPLEARPRPGEIETWRRSVREGAVPGGVASPDEKALESLFDRKLKGMESPPRKLRYVYKSERIPAVAVLSRSPTLPLFLRIRDYGLSGPTACAFVSAGRIQVAGRGTVSGREESWMLFWFSGGTGWDRLRYSEYAKGRIKDERLFGFDVPFLISLQRKPKSVSVGEDGIELSFPGEAGLVQVLPLLGVDRLSLETTSRWKSGLPPGIVRQAREWNVRLKFFPAQVREDYSVDAARDLVEITYSCRFVPAADEWGTPGSADAPLPPVVALAAEHGMPLRFSPRTADARCPTPFGPWWVAPGAKPVTVSIPGVASLVTRVPVPDVDRSRDADLLAKIEQRILREADQTGAGGWAGASIALTQGHKAACIPYVSPEAADTLRAATMRIVNREVFAYGRNAARLVDERRGRTYVVDYVNHFNRYPGDDEAPACEFPRGLWSYAFHTGDWATIRRFWSDLQGAGAGSYVRNNWVLQSRFDSGGGTFHDIILGTCAMARMAAVLGEDRDFGLFTCLLARHLVAYYGFEYALARHAVKYLPWFVAVDERKPMIVWDLYAPFGEYFAPYDAPGFYGPFTGFKEHYARIGEGTGEMADVMARFYRRFLARHARETFEGVEAKMKIDPKDGFWGLLFHLNAVLNDWDFERTRVWLEACPWADKENVTVLRVLYDKKHPPREVEILPPALRRKVAGRGVDLQSDGEGHLHPDVDVEARREPALLWFGFNAEGARVREGIHGSNTLKFGEIVPGAAKIVARETDRPNWVSWVHSFSLSCPTPEQAAAAEEQERARWMAVGPFGDQRRAEEQFDEVFEPEKDKTAIPDPAREYVGGVKYKEGRAEPPLRVRWREIRLGVKPLGDTGPVVPFAASCRLGFDHFGHQYLYTRVRAPADLDARIGMGYRGPFKVWINGEPVYVTRQRSAFKPDAHVFPATLRRGWNSILIKAQGVEFWESFFFAVCDAQEQLVPGPIFDPRGK